MPTRPLKLKSVERVRLNRNETNEDEVAPESPPAKRAKTTATASTETSMERWMLETPSEVLMRLHHCLLPAFNVGQHPIQSLDELQSDLSCKVSLPRPIYVSRQHCESLDICHRRTKARNIYFMRLNYCRAQYQTAHRKNRKLRNMEKHNIYPISLYNFAERLECDPDPFFHGSYDYYYTGGNLCMLPKTQVIHVNGKNLVNLNIGHLTEDDPDISLETVWSHPFEKGGEIFEVRPTRNLREDLPNCFAMRQRNSINLCSLQSSGVCKAIIEFKTKCVPFISFAQSSTDENTFVITTMNQKVRLYDLKRSTSTLYQTYDIKRTEQQISWNTVKPWQENTFLYANEREFFVMDTRSTPEQWLKTACTRPATDFLCDVISAVVPSEMENLAYVATNHKLHCLDLRKLGKDFESDGAICRWTHQMEYAPAFVDVLSYGSTEFIALSSALAGDVRICELTRKRNFKAASTNQEQYKYMSHVLPYQPPSLKDAYQKARLSGKCLNPEAALKNRIRSCTTGLAFYENEGKSSEADNAAKETLTLLLSSNSNGDVFAQSITRDSLEHERQLPRQCVMDIMCKYEEQVCRITQPELNHTDVVDLKAIRNVFLCNALSASRTGMQDEELREDGVTNEVNFTMPKRRSLGRWQKSLQSLHSYKDALVKNLLSIWDIEFDEKKDLKLGQINTTLGDKPDPEKLVSSWLDANITQPQENKTLNTSIKLNTSMISETCDLNETTKLDDFLDDLGTQQQSTQLMETLTDFSLMRDEECALPKSQSKVAKKKKYIKGF